MVPRAQHQPLPWRAAPDPPPLQDRSTKAEPMAAQERGSLLLSSLQPPTPHGPEQAPP